MNIDKFRTYWPTTTSANLSRLLKMFPLDVVYERGIVLLGVPLGTETFFRQHFLYKVHSCNESLHLPEYIPDARTPFHLHRVTATICPVDDVFRLTSPDFSISAAVLFDELQLAAHSRLNYFPVPCDMSTHIGLPLRLCGHGCTPLSPFFHGFYASSIVEAASVRFQGPTNPSVPFYHRMARRSLLRVLGALNPEFGTRGILTIASSLGPFQPDALLERSERVPTTLLQALCGIASRMYWETTSWNRNARPLLTFCCLYSPPSPGQLSSCSWRCVFYLRPPVPHFARF